MKRIFIGSIVAMSLLMVPSMASAHSGTVTCDDTGVIFTYNANFATPKTATEHVGNLTYMFSIVPNRVNTHVVPLPATSPVVASATWGGPGSITPRLITCPVTPPPVVCQDPLIYDPVTRKCETPIVVPPAPVCPEGYVKDISPNANMLLCTRTIYVNVPTPTLPATVPSVYYKCPKGTELVGYKSGATICLKRKTKIKTVTKTKIKIVYVDVPDDTPRPPKGNGVAG